MTCTDRGLPVAVATAAWISAVTVTGGSVLGTTAAGAVEAAISGVGDEDGLVSAPAGADSSVPGSAGLGWMGPVKGGATNSARGVSDAGAGTGPAGCSETDGDVITGGVVSVGGGLGSAGCSGAGSTRGGSTGAGSLGIGSLGGGSTGAGGKGAGVTATTNGSGSIKSSACAGGAVVLTHSESSNAPSPTRAVLIFRLHDVIDRPSPKCEIEFKMRGSGRD